MPRSVLDDPEGAANYELVKRVATTDRMMRLALPLVREPAQTRQDSYLQACVCHLYAMRSLGIDLRQVAEALRADCAIEAAKREAAGWR